MAWIVVIGEEAATGRMRDLYLKYREPSGGEDNILKLSRQSHNNQSYTGLDVEVASRAMMVPLIANNVSEVRGGK